MSLVTHDDVTVATVAAVCAALSLAPAVWAWWTVRGTQPTGTGAGVLTAAGNARAHRLGWPAAGPAGGRRRRPSRCWRAGTWSGAGALVTAIALTVVAVAFALASVVIVWLTMIDVNCPPDASDCL